MPSVPQWWQDPIGAIREGAERDASQRARLNDEDPQVGLFGSLVGANAEGAQEYTQQSIEKKGKRQLTAAGAGDKFVPGKTQEQYTEEARAAAVTRSQEEQKNSLPGQAQAAQITDLTEGRNQPRID